MMICICFSIHKISADSILFHFSLADANTVDSANVVSILFMLCLVLVTVVNDLLDYFLLA